jgi:hypothetical protein
MISGVRKTTNPKHTRTLIGGVLESQLTLETSLERRVIAELVREWWRLLEEALVGTGRLHGDLKDVGSVDGRL